MRRAAVVAAAGAAAALGGCGGAADTERDHYVDEVRPLLAGVTAPDLMASSEIVFESPFLVAADRLREVAAPATVRDDQRRLVRLLIEAEQALAESYAGTASAGELKRSDRARERVERAVRAAYATIRAICAKGYDIARTCVRRD